RDSAKAAGRPANEPLVDVWTVVSVDQDGKRALDDVRSWASAKARWMAGWKDLPESLERFRPEMQAAAAAYDFRSHLSVGADHAAVVGDELASRLAIAGDVDHCVARLVEIAEIG